MAPLAPSTVRRAADERQYAYGDEVMTMDDVLSIGLDPATLPLIVEELHDNHFDSTTLMLAPLVIS